MLLGAWTNSIGIGTILSAVVVIAAGWFAVKGRQAQSAREDSDRYRGDAEYERERAESFQKQVVEQRELKHAALTENARLKMLTDLTNVLKAIAELRAEIAAHFEAFGKALDQFERTQEAQTQVLQEMLKQLKGGTK